MIRNFLFVVTFGMIFPCSVIEGYISFHSRAELPLFAPGKVLVKLKQGYSIEDVKVAMQRKGAAPTSIRKKAIDRWYCIILPKGEDVLETVEEFKRLTCVEFAEPSYLRYFLFEPDDQHFSKQWSLKQSNDADIDADLAWDITQGSSTVKIGILDSGIDDAHPDLTSVTLSGYDFVDEDPDQWEQWGYELVGDYSTPDDDPSDDFGHGTHVSGIANAKGNNSIGIAGVSWNTKIVPIRVGFVGKKISTGEYRGIMDAEAIIDGLNYAVNQGCRVINMSFGGPMSSTAEHEAIINAYNSGCVLVAASGNWEPYSIDYPANYPEVIAVGATDRDDNRADYSNYGNNLNVIAPGGERGGNKGIYSTTPTYDVYMEGLNKEYDYMSGTSMASPHVAGLAALILSLHPDWPVDWVRNAIEQGADEGDSYKNKKIEIVEALSLEISYGAYFTYENTIFRPGPDHYVTLPFFIKKIGGKILYKCSPKVNLSISGNYAYTQNLGGHFLVLMYLVYPPPYFSLLSSSFCYSYKENILGTRCYVGGGISFLKTIFYLNGRKNNTFYLNPVINCGANWDIVHNFYIGIQSEICFPLIKWGNRKVHINRILPSISVNLGYKFIKRREL